MLNKAQARQLVEKTINKHDPANPHCPRLVILDDLTIEKEWGWVFFYNSELYLKTGDVLDALAGNAPYIVNKSSGELIVTGTAEDTAFYIEEYEAQL